MAWPGVCVCVCMCVLVSVCLCMCVCVRACVRACVPTHREGVVFNAQEQRFLGRSLVLQSVLANPPPSERERERQRDRERDRETDRQTDRQTDRDRERAGTGQDKQRSMKRRGGGVGVEFMGVRRAPAV